MTAPVGLYFLNLLFYLIQVINIRKVVKQRFRERLKILPTDRKTDSDGH